MPAEGQSTPATAPEPGRLVLRLLVLGLMIGLAESWCQHHLDLSLRALWRANIVVVVLAIVVSVFMMIRGKEAWHGLRRVLVLKIVSGPVLVSAALIMAFVGSTVSSIEVTGARAGRSRRVHAYPEPVGTVAPEPRDRDTRKLTGETPVARFVRFTTPFGRPYALDVDGYQLHFIDLFPGKGVRIRAERDLELAPTVLVRVPSSKKSLLTGGRIELWQHEEGACRFLGSVDTKTNAGAAFFGRRVLLPSDITAVWNMQLSASNLDDAARSRVYLSWMWPLLVENTATRCAASRTASLESRPTVKSVFPGRLPLYAATATGTPLSTLPTPTSW